MINKDCKIKSFLLDEFWRLSIQGAFSTRKSNVKIYSKVKNVKDSDKKNFRDCLREKIERFIIPKYINCTIDDVSHYFNIKKVQIYFQECDTKHILEGIPNIGICQKLLNLYLKYLWCINEISMPPHCPIDSIVLKEANIKFNWTEIDTLDQYKNIINSIKSTIGCLPLAVWELSIYNKKRQ